MEEAPPIPSTKRQFPCKNCGADLVFQPGTDYLICPHCGTENQIPKDPTAAVQEEDFRATMANLATSADLQDALTIKCTSCGAESQFAGDVVSNKCPFCGAPIVATAQSKKQIKPKSLLPFLITRDKASAAFRQWVSSLWFAPSALARTAERSNIDGAYIPAWTYDSDTASQYTGQRGDNYWETETYTETDANGNQVTRTRQVQKIRWTWVSGQVFNQFDDVLVLASNSLPRKIANRLEPWDLKNLVPYRDEYLSGFIAESYQIDLPQGFDVAKGIMDGYIRQSIVRDIGGDQQQISSVNTSYENITFKHALLPLWISAYRYQERVYRFLVNARSGEVQGERPYSIWKILLLVLAIILMIVVIVLIAHRQ